MGDDDRQSWYLFRAFMDEVDALSADDGGEV